MDIPLRYFISAQNSTYTVSSTYLLSRGTICIYFLKLYAVLNYKMIYFVPVLADARDFLLIIQFNSKAVEEFQTQIGGVCSTQLLEINTRIKQGFLICQTGKIFASGKKLFTTFRAIIRNLKPWLLGLIYS